MYHIYHTEAFVIGHRNSGEADRIFYLYTKDFGFVRAKATGIRKLESKLRFSLQIFSHVYIDLVRGKDTWRITSGGSINYFSHISRNASSLKIMAQISKLTQRLCAGEEANASIFSDLVDTANYLNKPDITIAQQKSSELTLVLRILHNLGYIGATDELSHYLHDEFDLSDVKYEDLSKKTILFEINRALKESQL